MTQGGNAWISAEWALWGKDANDREYRLLRCSEGIFKPRAFIDALDRYSPGTLSTHELPQVAFSWLRHPATGEPSHLGLAIYETAEHDPTGSSARSRFDAAGREIVYVRYFCVPYDELAARSADFWQFYRTFRDQPLHGLGLGLVSRQLAPSEPLPEDPEEEQFAQRVAAQLLTAQPVCVLGTNDVPTERRLRFLDRVMSGLPYGARSQFSAATWVNSSFTRHKHRLFFASSPREDALALPRANSKGSGYRNQVALRTGDSLDGRVPDLIVQWGRPDSAAPSTKEARDYLACDNLGDPAAQASLARDTDPVGIRRDTVREIVGQVLIGPHARRTVLELLQDLGNELRHGAGGLRAVQSYSDILSAKANQHLDEQDRADCWATVAQFGLLSNITRDIASRDQYYDTLFDVLIDGELTYADFLNVEDSLGRPLLQSPEILAALGRQSMPRAGVPRLLIRAGLDGSSSDIITVLRSNHVPPAELAHRLDHDARRSVGLSDPGSMTPGGEPLLRQDHGYVLLRPAARYLLQDTGFDPRAIRRVGYLATAFFYYYANDQDAQVTELSRILRETYGNRLGKREIHEIFHAPGHSPTDALLAAVKNLAPGFSEFTAHQFGQARLAAVSPHSPGNAVAIPIRGRAGQRNRPFHLGQVASERHGPLSPRAYVLAFSMMIIVVVGGLVYVLVVALAPASAPATNTPTPPGYAPASSVPGGQPPPGVPGPFSHQDRGSGRIRSRSAP